MRPLDVMRKTPWTVSGVAVAVAFALAGCGDDDFANDPRAPARITLAAVISPTSVTVSPSRLGAGTVELIASNLTSRSQRVSLSSLAPEGDPPLRQRTGPINPGDTASLTAVLSEGTYRVTASSAAIAPATIRVGPPRSSGQDTLLQP